MGQTWKCNGDDKRTMPRWLWEKDLSILSNEEEMAKVLLAWKKAENGEGYTLRLYESTGKDTAAVVALQFAGVTCPVSLKGFEIKTLHYDEQTKQLTEADLLD